MIGLGKQKKQVKENKAIISEGATRFTNQSARLFHWFFNVSSVCEDAAKLTAHYLVLEINKQWVVLANPVIDFLASYHKKTLRQKRILKPS